jgi:hypothetical protein
LSGTVRNTNVEGSQNEQVSLRKNRPKCCPSHFLVKDLSLLPLKVRKEKKVAQKSPYFCNLKHCTKKTIAQWAKILPIWSP